MDATTLTRAGPAAAAPADDEWLVTMNGPQSPPTLLIFPHAGAGAGAYRRLAKGLCDVARPVIVRLPGRESRLDEPAFTDIRSLVAALVPVLAPRLGDRFVLYGHSMGALIAFETARRLQAAGMRAAHLIVSGMDAPGDLTGRGRRHRWPDDRLWDFVCELGGVPPEIAGDPAMRELLLPPLRADFAVVDRYAYRPGPALRCPVTSFAGRADEETLPNQMVAWGDETLGEFRHAVLRGGHFFNLDGESGFAPALHDLLTGLHDDRRDDLP